MLCHLRIYQAFSSSTLIDKFSFEKIGKNRNKVLLTKARNQERFRLQCLFHNVESSDTSKLVKRKMDRIYAGLKNLLSIKEPALEYLLAYIRNYVLYWHAFALTSLLKANVENNWFVCLLTWKYVNHDHSTSLRVNILYWEVYVRLNMKFQKH